MTLRCSNCGAELADDVFCPACGTARSVSLPPGGVHGLKSVELVQRPEPASVSERAERQPEFEHPQAAISEYVDSVRADLVGKAGARTPGHRDTERRPKVGRSDVLITLVAAAVAAGLGWLVHADVENVGELLLLRSVLGIDPPTEYNGHDLLAVLITFSPFLVAALAAASSRVPGTGVGVAAASFAVLAVDADGPRVVAPSPDFDLNRDGVIVIVLGGFVFADLLLALTGRAEASGLLAGAVAGVGVSLYVAAYLQRLDELAILQDAWIWVLVLVVPAAAVTLAGLAGGRVMTWRGAPAVKGTRRAGSEG